MRAYPLFATMLLAGALTACASGGGNNAADNAAAPAGNEGAAAASYDPNSEQGRAYRAVLECAAR